MLRILTVPKDTAVLRTKSLPIKKVDTALVSFLKDFGDTLKRQHDPAGVGLSAIQAGKPLKVFATFLPQIKNGKPKLFFYINPEIVDHSKEMTLGEELAEKSGRPFLEGCLSIPRIYGPVLRWPWITARAECIAETQLSQSSKFNPPTGGQSSKFRIDGLASRVFQHELDHLNGILFTDHVLAQDHKLYREVKEELIPMEM